MVAKVDKVTTSAASSTADTNKLNLSHLEKSNSGLDAIFQDNPGVRKFLERNAEAIHKPKPGDVQTTFDWPVWTHSPTSGGVSKDAVKDIIIVWQEVPGSKAKINFNGNGYNSYAGEIIAVQQVNQRDGKTVQSYPAADKGFIWPNMKVTASGDKGQPVKMQWAVVTIDGNGNAVSGGYPGGWSGRTHIGRHGTPDYIPLKG